MISISATDTFIEVWPGSREPEISVLMPIYQQARYVRDAIGSILAQRGVVAEIIISDDASSDRTLEVALETVGNWLHEHRAEHRIVVRRGKQRLRRDHLPLLIDHAACDLVCQAHGDDISHPDRARILVAIFRARPNVTLIASDAAIVNSTDDIGGYDRQLSPRIQAAPYTYDDVLEGRSELIGCCQAWRRSAVRYFNRLDLSLAACAHDRILAFRAALVGTALHVKEKLIIRREHGLSWHKLMFEEPQTKGAFGWSLARMTALRTMEQDLAVARDNNLISQELLAELNAKIVTLNDLATRRLLEAFRIQTRHGRQIAWVDETNLLRLRQSR